MTRAPGRTSKQERRDRKRRETIDAHPWRLAHETMTIVAPPWAEAVRGLVERMRPAPGDPPVLVEERDLSSDEGLSAMLRGRFDLETRGFGRDRELALANVQCLATLAECAVNYEIGGRKAFWVDGGLAELLGQTTLDISGDVLKLPFPLRLPLRRSPNPRDRGRAEKQGGDHACLAVSHDDRLRLPHPA